MLRPGDLYLHDAETDHRFHFPESFEHLALRVPKSMAKRTWPELRYVSYLMFEGRSRPVNQLISSLSSGLMQAAGQLLEREVSASVTAAFDMFVKSVNARDPLTFDRVPPPDKILQRAKRFISHEIQDRNLSASGVASELGVSRRYLDMLFSRENTSATAHILRVRLERCAAELRRLRARFSRISDVAYAWGFRDAGQFSRAFRNRFGCSPSAYRSH